MKCCYFRPFEEKKMHNVGEIEYYGLKSKFMTMKLKLKIINELSFSIGKASKHALDTLDGDGIFLLVISLGGSIAKKRFSESMNGDICLLQFLETDY